MKKIIFGIFAHPDDEAFGPGGTLLMETRAGTELHLITLTVGDAGTNPDNHTDLGAVRLKEWQAAGKLLGASSMHFLGYADGQLNNQAMIDAGHKIAELAREIIKLADKDTVVEFMTLDLNGISGHIDHIVAARAACWAFYHLKADDKRLTCIRLCCVPHTTLPTANTDWLYMESGRSNDEIGEVVDARHLHDDIITIMRTHHTQRGDGESHIERLQENIGLNYFTIKT
ncbi:PIG-L family deacetylase [Candidatus Saccharibacteria bacterium]|nr:PIG-L family deacetylase [Candidatus Saccharibacteria bacterium]